MLNNSFNNYFNKIGKDIIKEIFSYTDDLEDWRCISKVCKEFNSLIKEDDLKIKLREKFFKNEIIYFKEFVIYSKKYGFFISDSDDDIKKLYIFEHISLKKYFSYESDFIIKNKTDFNHKEYTIMPNMANIYTGEVTNFKDYGFLFQSAKILNINVFVKNDLRYHDRGTAKYNENTKNIEDSYKNDNLSIKIYFKKETIDFIQKNICNKKSNIIVPFYYKPYHYYTVKVRIYGTIELKSFDTPIFLRIK